MTGPVQVKVEGARRLRATMRRAGLDMDDLRAAHASAAAMVVAASQTPRVSGALAGTVRGSGTKTAAIVRAGTARVPYAGPIHWGWPRRHIAAQPFLTTAAAGTESAWIELYAAAVDRALAQVKGK